VILECALLPGRTFHASITDSQTSMLRSVGVYPATLWARREKNTEWIAIQSFTVPQAREWAKWASKRVSVAERASETNSAEQAREWAVRANGRASASERTSEWPSTMSGFLAILAHSAPVQWAIVLTGFSNEKSNYPIFCSSWHWYVIAALSSLSFRLLNIDFSLAYVVNSTITSQF